MSKKDKKIKKLEKALKREIEARRGWVRSYYAAEDERIIANAEKSEALKALGTITVYNAEIIRLLGKK